MHLVFTCKLALFLTRIVCEVGSVSEPTEGVIEVFIKDKQGRSTDEVQFTYQVSRTSSTHSFKSKMLHFVTFFPRWDKCKCVYFISSIFAFIPSGLLGIFWFRFPTGGTLKILSKLVS